MLHLPPSIRHKLESWITAGYPHETCGLLIGQANIDNPIHVQVHHATQAKNLNHDRPHDRFELDPADFITADTTARAENLSIIGIWHSHPDHPAKPSQTDRDAAWEGWSYLIAAVEAHGVTDMRSWRLQSDKFIEEDIHS